VLSTEKCSKILNKNRRNYTQEQVKGVREKLYQLAEIIYESKISNDEEFIWQKSNTL